MQSRWTRGARLVAAAGVATGLVVSQGTARAVEPGAIPAGNPQHFINFGFGVPGDFEEYAYTVAVDTPLADDSVYYAHYVYGNGGGGYYSGIQPHPNGRAGVRFSFFGAGATPLHANCRGGADAGEGVTCGIDDLVYAVGREYTIVTTRTSDADGVSYTGTIEDGTTGRTRTIGSWRIPEKFTFSDSANAFIEKFRGIRSCADIPAVNVSYTGVRADGEPLAFKAFTRKATNTPGTGIYTCGNVSDYTVTTPDAGSYTVASSLASGQTPPDSPAGAGATPR